MTPYRLCVMHPMDPRGTKLGGIETHVRLILQRHPADFSVLFVGVDERGDCEVGRVVSLDVGGRAIDFLPVVRIDSTRINAVAKTMLASTTLRFALGALRHLPRLRAALRGRRASAELQRSEFALLPKLLRLPTVQMVHGEALRSEKMDSLIKTHWGVHTASEQLALRLADRVLCVNAGILDTLARRNPAAARKAEVMSVSVDTEVFRPTPFDCRDGIFRVAYAGRLDEFKDPPLMFSVCRALHERLHGRFEFHYVGTSDPHRYAEFQMIEAFTVRHGFQPAAGVAAIMARCHAGILTSFFEGLPCYLLEMLASGRPVAAVTLPQYEPLILAGISGRQVTRGATADASRDTLADTFVSLWGEIMAGRLDPVRISAIVEPYTVTRQMARLFDHHRGLQEGRPPPVRARAADRPASPA